MEKVYIFMSNLFVIGNGFDVAHGLPTRYINFKEYLYNKIGFDEPFDPNKQTVIRKMPVLPNNEPVKIDFLDEEMRFIYWLIEDTAQTNGDLKWNTFESLLGILEYEKVYEKYRNKECFMVRLSEALKTLKRLMFEWISTVDILEKTKPNKPFSYIINPDTDLAVNFNYTETLETVYGMDHENICYIHGQRETNTEKRLKNGLSSFGKNKSPLTVGYDSRILEGKYKDEDKRSDKEKDLMGLKNILIKESEDCVNVNKYCC